MPAITLTEEQLDALVTKRLETAMAGHQRDMEALKANRDEILREKREQKDRADTAARSASLLQAAERTIDQMYGRNLTPPAATNGHVISREDARDPAKYRAAKAAALAAGIKTGPTVTDSKVLEARPTGVLPSTFESARHVFIRRDVARDAVEYRQAKRLADQGGKTVRMFESRVDLDAANSKDPSATAAFDAAMRGDSSK